MVPDCMTTFSSTMDFCLVGVDAPNPYWKGEPRRGWEYGWDAIESSLISTRFGLDVMVLVHHESVLGSQCHSRTSEKGDRGGWRFNSSICH